jgi:hypothetical protein
MLPYIRDIQHDRYRKATAGTKAGKSGTQLNDQRDLATRPKATQAQACQRGRVGQKSENFMSKTRFLVATELDDVAVKERRKEGGVLRIQ